MSRVVKVSPATPLVLGSASSRRRELVDRLDLPFVVCAPSVNERIRSQGEAPDGYLDRIALAKLDAVRIQWVGDAAGVIVADTIVVSPGGTLLGKPASVEEAAAMIAELSGATHEVRTRFVLAGLGRDAAAFRAQTVATRVTFRPTSAGERQRYAASGEGLDKAGAYAIQGKAAAFIERIDGSYTNVVGLPLCEVFVSMREMGWV
jgi:septum formation protein